MCMDEETERLCLSVNQESGGVVFLSGDLFPSPLLSSDSCRCVFYLNSAAPSTTTQLLTLRCCRVHNRQINPSAPNPVLIIAL